ncbi:hypothetical protein BRARA_E00488 [Brassica rapa]|uniref:C6H2-type domain-containing protein n=1 Tax=Brassica campestris TaxID=3711 RepID=A0A397Z792_BRACM|nr:hypothetical protein BRARA_E00488 [Brassica rapa]
MATSFSLDFMVIQANFNILIFSLRLPLPLLFRLPPALRPTTPQGTKMAGEPDASNVATLSCARCDKPALLQCPKCVELKLPREGASFCTQDCFKAAWSSHKSVHVKAQLSSIANSLPGDQNSDLVSQGWLYCVRRGQGRTHKLPHFDWTGPLKQYLISPKRSVPAEIEKPDWAIDVSPYQLFFFFLLH